MDASKLPIHRYLPEIERLVSLGSLALSAETGSGKTSAVPAYLAERARSRGKIVVLEPRRLAAVSAASRVAELTGTRLGDLAGYRVRGATVASGATAVEFVTSAVFVRMIQDDPLLSGYWVVAIDEFHERSAWADLGLAFAAEAREARGELSILAMSATMDTDAVSRYLGSPKLELPGRTYPVEVSYRSPSPGERPEDAVASSAIEALGSIDGDVLAFLPGVREICATDAALRFRLRAGARVEILSLYGSMSLADQRRVVAPDARRGRRIILATNVAETSLTVPGVGAVVDLGLSRLARFHAPSGLDRLVTEKVTEAEAIQRAGRAGRTGPGLCIRCWDKADVLRPSRGAELGRVELSPFALECAVRGSSRLKSVRWLDEPPSHAWEAALAALRSIGLVDGGGAATASGRRAAALGTEPRAAAALLASESDRASLHSVALASALLAEREPAERDGDVRTRLERVLDSAPRSLGNAEPPASPDFDAGRLARILREASRLVSRLGRGSYDPAAARDGLERVGDSLAKGFADRLARRAGDGTWEFRSGRRAASAFAPPRVEWLLALDADAGDPVGRIRSAAPVDERAARAALAAGAVTSIEVEWRGLSASAWERTKSGIFTLVERRLERVPEDTLIGAFAGRLRAEGLGWLPWDDDSLSLIERARFVARKRAERGGGSGRGSRAEGEPGQPADLSDDALVERIARGASGWLSREGRTIDEKGLLGLIASCLGYHFVDETDREAPAYVVTPGGRRRRPVYPKEGPARLSGRIQEFFGLNETPKACGEPMTIELLSPADRPLQVTGDLPSFWKVAYPSIRAELARRYPKHYWPIDPSAAAPGRGLAPRR